MTIHSNIHGEWNLVRVGTGFDARGTECITFGLKEAKGPYLPGVAIYLVPVDEWVRYGKPDDIVVTITAT